MGNGEGEMGIKEVPCLVTLLLQASGVMSKELGCDHFSIFLLRGCSPGGSIERIWWILCS
uniref:Uncharacterized protein n=1 Tax=Arundo donax TaxID=35708 RepID=A0A0A9BH07_ARUDO